MRDSITLAAASVDRAGKLESILIAYYWTTLDPHGADGDTAAHTETHPDERRIRMVRLERPAPPHPTIYGVDLATLRYIAATRNLSAQTRTGETMLDYELWQDGRPALAQWLRRLTE